MSLYENNDNNIDINRTNEQHTENTAGADPKSSPDNMREYSGSDMAYNQEGTAQHAAQDSSQSFRASNTNANRTPNGSASYEAPSGNYSQTYPSNNNGNVYASGNGYDSGAQNNGYSYGTSYQNGFDTPYSRPIKKKEKRGLSAGATIALLLCVCILFSGAAGFGGAYLVFRYGNTTSAAGDGRNTVIYQSAKDPVAGNAVSADDDAISRVAAQNAESVVEITTETVITSSFYGQYVTGGAGSGVIISENGYIITCAHVIDGASSITVTLSNGESYPAELIGSDSVTDIAVVKINVEGLPCAVIGDSDSLIVGQKTVVIGNPLGELGGTVTDGIISALDRKVTIDNQSYNLLQTNAAINPGNSGGALFDINGNLIGIVNAKSSGSDIEGLGFAIPINDAIYVAQQLIDNGYIKGRPRLGIYVYDVTETTDLRQLRSSEYAALLNYITDYGPYFLEYDSTQEEGDLQFGDRIVAIDGIAVSSRSDMLSLLNEEYKVGDTITITVSRLTNFKINRSEMVDVELTLIENTNQNAKG